MNLKADVAERFGEVDQRLGANRLGAAERQPPTAQVERCPLFGADSPHAVLVGEVRRTADDPVVIADRLQPPHRPLQKRRRRHQHRAAAHVHGRQDAADQAHVVISGQPGHAGRRRDANALPSRFTSRQFLPWTSAKPVEYRHSDNAPRDRTFPRPGFITPR